MSQERTSSAGNRQNRHKRIWIMRLKTIVLATFLIVSAGLSGCASTSIYVLNQDELLRVKTGQTVTSKYDGWLLSDRAVSRVLNAKIKDANLR